MKKIIDLTFEIYEGMPTFPSSWHPTIEVSVLGRLFIEGRETRKVTLGTHTGTHIDAPLHFLPKGKTIDRLPLDILIGEAVLLDFSDKGEKCCIQLQELKEKLQNVDDITRVVIKTNWSDKWRQKCYYSDYPFLSEEACQWLIENGIKLLAMDTPSPDNPEYDAKSENDSPNHQRLLSHEVIIVEYLTNLKEINQEKFYFIALPLKLFGCDGSPARAIGIV